MIILSLVLLRSTLPLYEITVDPVFLEQLEANPFDELEFPAVVALEGVSGECIIAYRGGSSLYCTKKSWQITLDDPDLFPGGNNILLNAQFRDPSLMRNSLGMYITRQLGFPAPLTSFTSLSINGEYQGVYERVERIDRLFYQRNGLVFGPLFKNTNSSGRLMQHFSGTDGIDGFEPRVDSDPYGDQLLELIENCFLGDCSSLATEEVLAAFAVNTAIGDQDGLIKNFYLHRSDGVWHYYPWDRDATFGNSWRGEYDSMWVTRPGLSQIGYFGASRGILSLADNRDEFNRLLGYSADILEEDLPDMVDSIRLLIRSDLSEDPYYEYTVSEFDSICGALTDDLHARADFLEDIHLENGIPEVQQISISSCLNMSSSVEVELSLAGEEPMGVVCLVAIDKQREQWLFMESDTDGEEWSIEVDIPHGAYSVHFAFGPFGFHDILPVFYPAWGIRENDLEQEPSPSARVSLADFSPELLSPGTPVWCGENLWVLPITNTGSAAQDLSLCRFSAGNPPGNIFMAESTLVAPGKTFYLSNSAVRAGEIYGSSCIYGDAGAQYPEGTLLQLMDPSWNQVCEWQIGSGDSLPQNSVSVIPSEIAAGDGNDWIELFNNSQTSANISGWYFMDVERNVSMVPGGTCMGPGGLLLAASDPAAFDGKACITVPLDFGLSCASDSLFLYSSLGDRIFSMGWNELWPIETSGIMYLKSPLLPITSPRSWEYSAPPGSPGETNPGWTQSCCYTRVNLLSQNPCNGSFSFRYETTSLPAYAMLFDLAGRSISRIDLPFIHEGTVSADFSGMLPSGVYILFLRSTSGVASTRLTVLN